MSDTLYSTHNSTLWFSYWQIVQYSHTLTLCIRQPPKDPHYSRSFSPPPGPLLAVESLHKDSAPWGSHGPVWNSSEFRADVHRKGESDAPNPNFKMDLLTGWISRRLKIEIRYFLGKHSRPQLNHNYTPFQEISLKWTTVKPAQKHSQVTKISNKPLTKIPDGILNEEGSRANVFDAFFKGKQS